MDTLNKLQVLSLGNNLMASLDALMYLRPKKALQAVTFVGNPFCQEVEYRAYVLAHLKYLKYLDYRLVDELARSTRSHAPRDAAPAPRRRPRHAWQAARRRLVR